MILDQKTGPVTLHGVEYDYYFNIPDVLAGHRIMVCNPTGSPMCAPETEWDILGYQLGTKTEGLIVQFMDSE